VVARIEEATNRLGDLLTLPPLDLTVVEEDITRLLAPDGPLCRIYASDEDALAFQLDPKCDTCTHSPNSVCLAEAARKRQVQLIGCSTTTTRILHAASVTTIDAAGAGRASCITSISCWAVASLWSNSFSPACRRR
jgi:hypothetical protein